MRLSRTHSTKRNGPVPTGRDPKSCPAWMSSDGRIRRPSRGQRCQKRRMRFRQANHHAVRRRSLNRFDYLVLEGTWRAERFVPEPVEGGYHVGGVEGRPVVKRDTLSQRELPHQSAVTRFPRCGQRRHELSVLAGFQQRIVDAAHRLECQSSGGRVGIQRVGTARQTEHQRRRRPVSTAFCRPRRHTGAVDTRRTNTPRRITIPPVPVRRPITFAIACLLAVRTAPHTENRAPRGRAK